MHMISICRIPLDAVFEEGSLPESVYKLVKEEEYCGEIKVALTFTPEVIIMLYNFFSTIFLHVLCLFFSPYYQLLVAEK